MGGWEACQLEVSHQQRSIMRPQLLPASCPPIHEYATLPLLPLPRTKPPHNPAFPEMSKETSPSSSPVEHLVTARSKVKDYENESAVVIDISHIRCQMSRHTQTCTFAFFSLTVAKDLESWFHMGNFRVITFRALFLRVLASLLIVAHIFSLCFLIFICLKMCHFAFIFRKWSLKKNLFHMVISSLFSRTHHWLSNL